MTDREPKLIADASTPVPRQPPRRLWPVGLLVLALAVAGIGGYLVYRAVARPQPATPGWTAIELSLPALGPERADGPWISLAASPLSPGQNRLVVARLQQADPELPGDLGWITVDTRRMDVANYERDRSLIAWGTTLGASELIPLQRPGPEASAWRVTVEEWERFPGDPEPGSTGVAAPPPVWEQRLVFADEIYL